jgi:hypothetical protein
VLIACAPIRTTVSGQFTGLHSPFNNIKLSRIHTHHARRGVTLSLIPLRLRVASLETTVSLKACISLPDTASTGILMRNHEYETVEEIFYDACFAAGTCCLRLASEGGELNRERLAIELMQLFK